jgi:hypothetical protein
MFNGQCSHPARTPNLQEWFPMIKKVWIVLLGVSMFVVFACGGKYDEAKTVLNDYADATEAYVTQIDKSGDADTVAAAIKAYTAKLAELTPKLQKIHETYPELRTGKDLPQELEKIGTRMEAMGEKMQASMMKIMPYMMDPAVQKAMTEQAQAMMKAGQQ